MILFILSNKSGGDKCFNVPKMTQNVLKNIFSKNYVIYQKKYMKNFGAL